MVLQLDLLPAEDVEPYLYVEGRIAESTLSYAKSKPARDGGVMTKSLGSTNFGFCNILKQTNGNIQTTVTNGTDVTEVYAYTVWHTSTVVVVTWTNEQSNVVTETNTVWTPVSPSFNGLDGIWECQTTNHVLTNGVGAWEDANIPSNISARFYATARRVDSDVDGLTDGAEIFLYRTNPESADTDGDGMPDGWEVQYGLNALSGLDDSLVGWWKLDDGAGSMAVNSVTGGYHGDLTGFAGTPNSGWVADGKVGGALRFDGVDDIVEVAQSTAMLTGGPFTISAWAWLDAACTSVWPEVVSDYDPSSWDGYCLGFDTNQSPYAMIGFSGWTEDTNTLTDQWVWVALEYDGADMRLYRNGELADGPVSAGFICSTNDCFAFGDGQDPDYSEHWQGLIDDVRIYQSAIGTNGLAALYDAFDDTDGDGLVNLEESVLFTNPFHADTDDDGIPDGEDPEPTLANQEPIVRFRYPRDGQEFYGPSQIELSSDWLYSSGTPSHVVYQLISETDWTTNELQVSAAGEQSTNWYAPPGDFHLLIQGVDNTGRMGETQRVDITILESSSFAALSASNKQVVLEKGPTAVEGVEQWFYNYSHCCPV